MAPKTHKKDKHGRSITKAPADDLPMRRFIENVPEPEFQRALESSTDPKIASFLAARLDPAYRTSSFASLCRKFTISLQEIDDLWRNHQLHTGMIQMMSHVPQVLNDVAEDAKSRNVICVACRGNKTILEGDPPMPIVCPNCSGDGVVRKIGDKAARELVFESIGLTGKRSPMVAIQQNFGLDSGLEDVLMSTQRVISGGSQQS